MKIFIINVIISLYQKNEENNMSIYNKLINLIKKYNLNYYNNILPGHSKVKLKRIIPIPANPIVDFNKVTNYFICFTKSSIILFITDDKWNPVSNLEIHWNTLKKFKIKKGLVLEDTMYLEADNQKLAIKLFKRMAKNTWVRENNLYLHNINFYYPKI